MLTKIAAPRIKFFIKKLYSKYDQIWSHLLKRPLMKNFTFCAVNCHQTSGARRVRGTISVQTDLLVTGDVIVVRS